MTSPTPYDEVPYASHPYRQTHPDRLATIATLLGLQPASPAQCRVLELGCAAGGNLIPLAARLPGSQFVGIDASARQVDEAHATIAALGLTNVRVSTCDIRQFDPASGPFDYIIAHGVYSWVPADVQERMLEICRDHLAPAGVAYISYNTYPGWHFRGLVRDVMKYRARSGGSPADRIRQARALVDFLVQTVPEENNAYGILLRGELNLLRDKQDSYLLHEHLEDVNEPTYFHQFVERAEAQGLQYLGEADFGTMCVKNFTASVTGMLENLSSSVIEMEQYMDFVRNRMFRQTLLCRRDLAICREPQPAALAGLFVASPARPEGQIVDLHGSEPAKFHSDRAVTTTSEPLMKAALVLLAEVWPAAMPLAGLVSAARSRLDPAAVVVDSRQLSRDVAWLGGRLLRCYETGQVELGTLPTPFTLVPAGRPRAFAVARLQAASANLVTNLRHESVRLDDLERHVVGHLTGAADEAAVVEHVVAAARSGQLLVHHEGQPIADEAKLRVVLAQPVHDALQRLARKCLLEA